MYRFSLSLLVCVFVASAATVPTTTTLSIVPAGQAPHLSTVKLTATVTDAGGNPVSYGTVTFLDGTLTLGTVQLTVHPTSGETAVGTALWRIGTSWYPEMHLYSAQFNPLEQYSRSRSKAIPYEFVPRFPFPTLPTLSLEPPTRDITTGKIGLKADLGFSNGLCCEFYTPPGQNGTVIFRDTTAGVNLGVVPVDPWLGLAYNGVASTQISSATVNAAALGDFDEDGETDVIAPVVGQASIVLV